MQAELAPPPQNVLGGARPLDAGQVVELGGIQAGRDFLAELRQRRCGTEHPVDPGAVGARKAPQQRRRQPWPTLRLQLAEALEVGHRVAAGGDRGTEIAAGQRSARGPVARRDAERPGQHPHRLLGQRPVGGELAAPDRQQRRAAGVEFEPVVAGDRGRIGAVVEQRPHAAVGPHHVGRRDLPAEVAVDHRAQVVDLGRVGARLAGIAADLDIGGADQRELALERDREHDPLVGILEDVRVRMLEQLPHDDVASLDQPQRAHLRPAGGFAQEARRPRPGGVDQTSRPRRPRLAVGVDELGPPQVAVAADCRAARASEDGRAALVRIERVEHHQPRVVDPAVRIHDAGAPDLLQRPAGLVPPQVDRLRPRQDLAPRQVVVEEQAHADHPHRPHRRIVRDQEAQRPDDVRRIPQQHLALGERLAHQPELVVLQVAKAAVHQLGRRRRGVRAEVVLLDQQHLQAAARGIAGDAGAVDAAADDQEVERLFCRSVHSVFHAARASRPKSTRPRREQSRRSRRRGGDLRQGLFRTLRCRLRSRRRHGGPC